MTQTQLANALNLGYTGSGGDPVLRSRMNINGVLVW